MSPSSRATEQTQGPAASPAVSRTVPDSAPPRFTVSATWLRIVVSVVLAILLLLAAAGLFTFLSGFKPEPVREEPTARVLRVETYLAERADLSEFVRGFGTARADREVQVSAEVAGQVTETQNLRVGNRVRGREVIIGEEGRSIRRDGEVIIQIDPQTYRERVEQAAAMVKQDEISLSRLEREHATNERLLDQQQQRLETIQRELRRFEELFAQGAGRESDVQRTRLEVEQYREGLIRLENEIELYPIRKQELHSRMASHQNDLKLAELDLEKATVAAPFTGILSDVFIEQGQYVRPGDPLVRITDVNRVEVAVPLSLRDAALAESLIAAGRAPRAELARNEDHFTLPGAAVWSGTLRRIAPVADERTRTVRAFIEVENLDQETPLKPGTFAYARIQAGLLPASAGVLIPRDAIVGGHVFVVRGRQAGNGSEGTAGRRAVRQKVEIERVIQTFALVQNVQAGDRIVMTNLDIVGDGSPLSVQSERTLDEELARLRVPYLQRARTPTTSAAQ